jgi:hypothetical protein
MQRSNVIWLTGRRAARGRIGERSLRERIESDPRYAEGKTRVVGVRLRDEDPKSTKAHGTLAERLSAAGIGKGARITKVTLPPLDKKRT